MQKWVALGWGPPGAHCPAGGGDLRRGLCARDTTGPQMVTASGSQLWGSICGGEFLRKYLLKFRN